MKIENEKDFKMAEQIVNGFKKANLANFTGAEAYVLIASLEWMVMAMAEFKKPPTPPVTSDTTSKVTNISSKKSKT